MTKLLYFSEKKGLGVTLRLDSGEPCTISIAQWNATAQGSVRARKSRIGLFGKILYDEKDQWQAAMTSAELEKRFPENLLPITIEHAVLRAYANAIWRCSSAVEVARLLNEVTEKIKQTRKAQATPLSPVKGAL